MERPRTAKYGGKDILCTTSLAAVNAGTAGAPVDLETKDRRGDAVGEYDRTAVGHTQPYIVFWRQGIRG